MIEEPLRRTLAVEIAKRFLGMPYMWGGDDPIKGFDCSGLVVEILKSVNLLERTCDHSADSLARLFPETDNIKAGCLILWLDREKKYYSHVEMAINDELTIGASGGGSKTVNIDEAVKSNAYVKIRPFGQYARAVDPFKFKPKWWVK